MRNFSTCVPLPLLTITLIADVWALGVLLWCIYNQKYPFDIDDPEVVQQQMAHKIKFNKRMGFKPDDKLRDMFYRMLEPNVDERITLQQLMDHPWIAKEVRLVEAKVPKCSEPTAANTPKSPSPMTNKDARTPKPPSAINKPTETTSSAKPSSTVKTGSTSNNTSGSNSK